MSFAVLSVCVPRPPSLSPRCKDPPPLLTHRRHGFSGDTFQHEVALAWQVKTTQTASNVHWGYWSHDIGGFHKGQGAPGDSDPTNSTGAELLLRWIQFGAVAPILRTHCDHCERRIWLFPLFEQMRDAMRLRNALGPAIYTAARQFYDTGVALLTPLYYNYAADAAVYTSAIVERQYLFLDRILAAPITIISSDGSGAVPWDVYLPEGTWTDWNGTAMHTGPTTISATYGAGDMPLFVRDGGLLPLKTIASVARYADPVVWALWPSAAAAGNATMYEDEGDSDAYQGGQWVTTVANYTSSAGSVILTIAPAQVSGALPPGFPAARGLALQLRGVGTRAVASVTVNGAALQPAALGVVPGWAVVSEAQHTLAEPAGALVVSAGAALDVFAATTIAVTLA